MNHFVNHKKPIMYNSYKLFPITFVKTFYLRIHIYIHVHTWYILETTIKQRCAENESMPENCFSWNANSGSGFYFSGTYVPVLLSWNLLNSKNPWFMCFGRKVGLSVNVLLISSLPNHILCRIFKGLLIIVSCAFNVSPWSHNLFIWQLSANCVIFLLFHISC